MGEFAPTWGNRITSRLIHCLCEEWKLANLFFRVYIPSSSVPPAHAILSNRRRFSRRSRSFLTRYLLSLTGRVRNDLRRLKNQSRCRGHGGGGGGTFWGAGEFFWRGPIFGQGPICTLLIGCIILLAPCLAGPEPIRPWFYLNHISLSLSQALPACSSLPCVDRLSL